MENRLTNLALLGMCMFAVACSGDEPKEAEKTAPPETEELRKTIHAAGNATLATLSISKMDKQYRTEFTLHVDTIDYDDCVALFEKTEPWVALCKHIVNSGKGVSLTTTLRQIPAGGEEAYGGMVKSGIPESVEHYFVLFPSYNGDAAVRIARAAGTKEFTYKDKIIRFDKRDNKVQTVLGQIQKVRQRAAEKLSQ